MSNLRILRLTLIPLACILFISTLFQCSSLLQIEKLKNCEFRLERIEGMSIDGINLSRMRSFNDLGFINATKILQDLSKGFLPSEFTIIFSVSNPNKTMASMEKFEYIIMLDETEIVTGSSNDRIEIPANGSTEFTLTAKADISKLLKQNSIAALMELANSMNKENAIENRVRIKVKPYIRIGKKLLKYPGFIEIKIKEWSK